MSVFPTREEFAALAAKGNMIPVYREAPADLETPVSAFIKLKAAEPDTPAFLLESVEKGELVGRYSFLGADLSPLLRMESGAEGDPLAKLKELMAGYRVVPLPGLPGFWGGAVGYLGYDVVRAFEKLPDRGRPPLGVPDCMLMLTDKVVIFDHVKQKMQVVVLAHVPRAEEAGRAYDDAIVELERMMGALATPIQRPQGGNGAARGLAAKSNFTREEYMAAVGKAKEYIAAGDIFQVVLSQRLVRKTSAHPMNIYRALRMLNPSPYLFYLDLQDFQLIGSSPEMLVKLEDGVAETRPLAGTRPRGKNDDADRALATELMEDPKERAEHVMLVDLGRNDLGRVCEYGSVRVPTLMEVEKYSHVMHIVSSVKGRLQSGRDQFDLERACFPAGTVSGAPKIRAMQIIEELEPSRRGPYAGAVGYFSFSGNMNTCITIRTLVMRGDEVWFQAGAGIVADSDAEREYEETLNKIAAVQAAVDMAEEGLE